MVDEAYREFMGHVLDELRKVEGAESPEKSIYMQTAAGAIGVTDSTHREMWLVSIERTYSGPTYGRATWQPGGALKVSGRGLYVLNVRALGRRYERPLAVTRDPANVPWLGYNYASMHKATIGFLATVAAARKAYAAKLAGDSQLKAALIAAISKAGRPFEDVGHAIHVPLAGSLLKLNPTAGAFTVRGAVTVENAKETLDALEALYTAQKKEGGKS